MPYRYSRASFFLLLLCLLPVLLPGQKKEPDLYAWNHIVEVDVLFKDTDWQRKLHALKQAGEDGRLVMDVKVDGKLYEGAGIRYKGNSSYFNVIQQDSDKLPFNIKVNYEEKKNRLPGGYTSLKLSNVFRDPTFLREVMSYDIASKYMPASRANFARVSINGEYLGLYNLTQSVDDDLLETFYGHDDGTLIKCDPDYSKPKSSGCPDSDKASLQYLGENPACYLRYYELKSDRGWTDLIEFTRILNKQPEKLESILHIDEALWMLAFDNAVVNLDSYIGHLCHNYYMYRDTFGIFHPVVWDMNLSFGGFRYTGIGKPLTNGGMQNLSIFLHYQEKNQRRPLVLELLKTPLFRKIYVAHIKTIYEENIADGKYVARAEEWRKLIRKEVVADKNRLYPLEWFDLNFDTTITIDDHEIIGLRELMVGRAKYLSEHPLIKTVAPAVSPLPVEPSGENVKIAVTATATDDPLEAVWLFYRPAAFLPWKRMPLDAGEEDRWSVTLPRTAVQEYYFVAEGKQTAGVFPVRASKEFLKLEAKEGS